MVPRNEEPPFDRCEVRLSRHDRRSERYHSEAVIPSNAPWRNMSTLIRRGPVVELGPGTGAITSALIEHGVDQKRSYWSSTIRLLCVAAGPLSACQGRTGRCYTLRDSLRNVLNVPPPLLSPACRLSQADADAPETGPRCLRNTGAGAPFVQFTYSVGAANPESLPACPRKPPRRIWMNLPPARVWVYRKG